MRDRNQSTGGRCLRAAWFALLGMIIVAGCAPSHEKVRLRVTSGGGLAVMAFEDRTGGTDGLGKQVAHQFASRLAINMGNVLEPHQMEALFAEAGATVPEGRTAEAYESIREITHCDVMVLGSVNDLTDGDGFESPRAAVSVRLIDLASGYTLYARAKAFPESESDTHNREAGYLVLDCADYLADRMTMEVAFVEVETE